MDLVTPLMQALQANANLEHTEAVTQDTRALAQQRILNTQVGQIKLAEQQATRNVLMQALQGQNLTDPGLVISATDTPIQAAQKNVTKLQQDAQRASDLAVKVMQGGGDPAYADKLQDNATQARYRAVQAQRELIAERQNQLKVIGGVAGTVRDEDSFQMAYKKLSDLDPEMAKGLMVDRDTAGAPIYGPRSQRTMATIANSSLSMNEQLDKDIKARNELDRQAEVQRKIADDDRKAQETDSKIARNQAQARYYDRRDGSSGARAGTSKPVEAKPATGPQKKSAAAAVDAEFGEAEFDGSKDALVADVADRANKIMAEAKKNGETIGLDDARQQALDELKPFVAQKSTTKGGIDLPLIGKVGATTKSVNTYVRGGANKQATPQYIEGQTATNPKTGEKLIYQNGQWTPVH